MWHSVTVHGGPSEFLKDVKPGQFFHCPMWDSSGGWVWVRLKDDNDFRRYISLQQPNASFRVVSHENPHLGTIQVSILRPGTKVRIMVGEVGE